MQQYPHRTMEFLRDERGASATEYALLLSLIAAALVMGVTAFGGALSDYYGWLAANLNL